MTVLEWQDRLAASDISAAGKLLGETLSRLVVDGDAITDSTLVSLSNRRLQRETGLDQEEFFAARRELVARGVVGRRFQRYWLRDARWMDAPPSSRQLRYLESLRARLGEPDGPVPSTKSEAHALITTLKRKRNDVAVAA